MKLKKFLPYCSRIGGLLAALTIILASIGSQDFCGFGVDSKGTLYIGRKHQVEVYVDGERTDTFPVPVRRGWKMALTEDDTIFVADGTSIHILSLDGTVTGNQEDFQSKMCNEMEQIREIIGADGSYYKLTGKRFWPVIRKNGTVIYRAPFIDFAGKITLMGTVLFFGVAGIYDIMLVVKESRESENNSKESTEDSTGDGLCEPF